MRLTLSLVRYNPANEETEEPLPEALFGQFRNRPQVGHWLPMLPAVVTETCLG